MEPVKDKLKLNQNHNQALFDRLLSDSILPCKLANNFVLFLRCFLYKMKNEDSAQEHTNFRVRIFEEVAR